MVQEMRTLSHLVADDEERVRPALNLSPNARIVLEKRYLRRGPDGKPIETPEEMFDRVARVVAEPDARYGGDPQVTRDKFYDLLTTLRFFPNSPTFTGAGTPLGQLAACFTADMRVTIEQGMKRIADLQIGDRVLTHLGRYRPVTQVMQRAYRGKLIHIKVKLIGTTLQVTPEHPILTPEGWRRAGDLQTGDLVAIGVPQGVQTTPRFDLAEWAYAGELETQVTDTALRVRRPSTYQNSGRQAGWINRFLELTPELARLCGYYISEGTVDPEERYVRFTFGRDEEDYQRDVVELVGTLFGVSANRVESHRGNWITLNVYARAVAIWFRSHFGQHSYGKRVPVWMQYAPPDIQKEFLSGIMRGDGLYNEQTYQLASRRSPKMFRALRLTLSNPSLIQQVWQMCLRLGYDAAIRPVDTSYVTANARATAQISLPPLQSRELVQRVFGRDLPEPDQRYVRKAVLRQGDRVYFQIQSIESDDYAGMVYNCEVDEDHSYVTEGIVVHNCFVLPIADDMGRDPRGIFSTLRAAALIQQTGGGNGFSFSRLRPRGDRVSTSAGVATGPVGFLRVYDTAFGEVAQGGTRRGANMAVLRVDHPDIFDFIRCKATEGAISNFNISVGVTDEFMRAVEADGDFDLINPRDGSVWRTVRACELFNEIVKYAHHNGEPGVLFLDTANRANPVPHLYELEATNPCGEQWLGPYENCCLGSINLAQHITPDDRMDWAKLRDSVELAVHFLDNVVDANKYVPAIPELAASAHRARRIGLGIMGLGDAMYRLGIRYGSRAGEDFAGQVMEFVRYYAMKKSIELAKTRGAFPAIKGSIYDPENLKWTPPKPLRPFTHDWGRPQLDWGEIVIGIKKYGIRNAAQTTVAPTGTIATVAGVESYGCEPVFALAYTRHVNDNGKDLQLEYVSPLFERALMRAGVDAATRQKIFARVRLTGTCQDIDLVPETIRHTFVVASDITPEEHVYMQAALQAFVDNAISKTINFPEKATVEDVERAYFLAWKLGCKGITVYRAGSREQVVLETQATAAKKAVSSETALAKKPRPRAVRGSTYEIATPLGKAYVTINRNGEGEPFEVFCNVGKAGSDTTAVSEAIGRLISLVLRLPSPMSPTERLQEIVDQLSGIGGGRSLGFGARRVRSLPDGIAQALAEDLGQARGELSPAQQIPLFKIGDLCPECGQAAFVNEEGCRKCYACGYSEC